MATYLQSNGTAFAGIFGPDAILTSTGAPVTNTPVSIYSTVDGVTVGPLASTYTDQTKVAAGANPISTDGYGNLLFYANPGLYILSFSVGGVVTNRLVEILPLFPDAAWNIILDTAAITAISGDCHLANATSAAFAVTLPVNAGGYAAIGARVKVVKTDSATANAVSVTCGGTAVILGPGLGAGVATYALTTQGSSIELIGDGTNWHVTGGSVGALGGNPSGRLYATAGTALTSGTAAALALAGVTAPQYMIRGGMTVTGANALVAPVSGWYDVSCGFTITPGVATGVIVIQIGVSGTVWSQAQVAPTAITISLVHTDSVYIAAGAYVQVFGIQSTGGPVTTIVGAAYPTFLTASLNTAA